MRRFPDGLCRSRDSKDLADSSATSPATRQVVLQVGFGDPDHAADAMMRQALRGGFLTQAMPQRDDRQTGHLAHLFEGEETQVTWFRGQIFGHD